MAADGEDSITGIHKTRSTNTQTKIQKNNKNKEQKNNPGT